MWKSREDRRRKFFGDIVPEAVIKSGRPRSCTRKETDEMCKQLLIELGLYRKHLKIKGEKTICR